MLRSPIRTSVAALALAAGWSAGCVAEPHREGVGGYCHRDEQCLVGLHCIELSCRMRSLPPDAALREDAGIDAAADAGPPEIDAGTDAGQDAGAIDAGTDAPPDDAGGPDAAIDAA